MSCEPVGSGGGGGSASASLHHDDDDSGADDEVINWHLEAQAIIKDLKPYVTDIHVSTVLPATETAIYLNITTLEEQQYCVKVDAAGFRIVSDNAHNTIEEEHDAAAMDAMDDGEIVYETPYALLNRVSPRYVDAFGNALCKQLLQLAQMRTEFNEEDEDDLNEDDEEEEEEDRRMTST